MQADRVNAEQASGGLSFRKRAKSALRGAGMRWTQQRDTLIDVIEKAQGHLDVDELYRLARQQDPRLSLSTVYRTLAVLKRHRLVDELHLTEEHHHYEAKIGAQHFHMLCTSCGTVTEFSGALVDRLQQELRREHGFTVESIDLDVSGVCARCTASQPAAS